MRPTLMHISMSTIAHNGRVIRSLIPKHVRMTCIVKSDAYGHNAAKVAHALEDVADAYAVAIVEEARILREQGIEKTILVLGGAVEQSLREAVRLNVSQTVFDIDTLRILEDEACRQGKLAKAHLKIDTGMSRIGVRNRAKLESLFQVWKNCSHVHMEGCFTHFSVADTDLEFTRLQNEYFLEILEYIRGNGFSPIAHAACSYVMLNPAYQHDMVRPGIALYGCSIPELDGLIKPAQTLVTRPVRIEKIQIGDSVGYGRSFIATRDTTVMTLPIGYGDGYPRTLSNRGVVLVHGRRAPLIGRVCMDMIMVDITDIPNVTLNDEVVLMGCQGTECITPDELGDLAGTNSYAVMLGFLPRVPRVFLD